MFETQLRASRTVSCTFEGVSEVSLCSCICMHPQHPLTMNRNKQWLISRSVCGALEPGESSFFGLVHFGASTHLISSFLPVWEISIVVMIGWKLLFVSCVRVYSGTTLKPHVSYVFVKFETVETAGN